MTFTRVDTQDYDSNTCDIVSIRMNVDCGGLVVTLKITLCVSDLMVYVNKER